MLESGQEHSAIRGLHENMTAVGVLGTVPWLMSMLSKIPGATGSYSRFTDWCGQELKEKREVSYPSHNLHHSMLTSVKDCGKRKSSPQGPGSTRCHVLVAES